MRAGSAVTSRLPAKRGSVLVDSPAILPRISRYTPSWPSQVRCSTFTGDAVNVPDTGCVRGRLSCATAPPTLTPRIATSTETITKHRGLSDNIADSSLLGIATIRRPSVPVKAHAILLLIMAVLPSH